ncbi:MAG: WcaF family extracellular polysaccharide biosynthesis acetyltransferase [Flavobacteriales bacterium]
MAQGKTDLSRFDNSWYRPGNVVKRTLWYCVNSLFFHSRCLPFSGFKVMLLRLFGASVGEGVVIRPSVNIKYPWHLVIGDQVWIGEHVWIDSLGKVVIGNHVCISQGALILSGNHDYKKETFDLLVKDIVLDDGVWIGARAVVCQGVRCGSHAVLSAGSVAQADLEPYAVYRGNPAEKIRERIIE